MLTPLATAAGGSAVLRPYLAVDGREQAADSVAVTREPGRIGVAFRAAAAGTYSVGIALDVDAITPLSPGRPPLTHADVSEPRVLRYPYDWSWHGKGNVLSRRPRLVMPGLEAGGKLYVVDTRELWSLRIQRSDGDGVTAFLLAHRVSNAGGDVASDAIALAGGEEIRFTIRMFDTLAQAKLALYGEPRPLTGRMVQIAYRGWTARRLSPEAYSKAARRLRGLADYVIIREVKPLAWIPPLFREQGIRVWFYQFWGALRRHSSQVTAELEQTIGLRDGKRRLYTAPSSPKGSWLLCDIRREDVRSRFVANARQAVEAGYDGVFLDGYPVWADATGRRGGHVPGAGLSLHAARARLLTEIRSACRAVRPDAVVGVLANQYVDIHGFADFALKERMYWGWAAWEKQFDKRRTRICPDMDLAFEADEAPFAAANLAYGFKGHSPVAVHSARHFARQPPGLLYLGTGDFLPDRLDEWLDAITGLLGYRGPTIAQIDPSDASLVFDGVRTFRAEQPCRLTFSSPVCVSRAENPEHRLLHLDLNAGDSVRLLPTCVHRQRDLAQPQRH